MTAAFLILTVIGYQFDVSVDSLVDSIARYLRILDTAGIDRYSILDSSIIPTLHIYSMKFQNSPYQCSTDLHAAQGHAHNLL